MSWRCPTCQMTNAATSVKCGACGRASPASPVPSAFTAGVSPTPTPAGGRSTPTPPPTPAPPFSGTSGATSTPPPANPFGAAGTPLPPGSQATPYSQVQHGTTPASSSSVLGGLTTDAREVLREANNDSINRAGGGGAGGTTGRRSGATGPSPSPAPNYQQQMHPMERKQYEKEIEFLRGAVSESKKFGIEIENTVEYLTDLLRRKTLECESLRSLATENYEPVRVAIAEQYKAQRRTEKNTQNELKFFQGRIESLYAERTTLLTQNVELKEQVEELERNLIMAQQTKSKADEMSFFNKVLYDDRDMPPFQDFRVSMQSPAIPVMSQLTLTSPSHYPMLKEIGALDWVRYVCEPNIALRLHHFGFFNYMQHLLTTLLIEQDVVPDSFAAGIGNAYKSYLRELKEPAQPASSTKNAHFREKLFDLYSYFLPEQTPERDALLQLHEGREFDLWENHIAPMAEIFEEKEKELLEAQGKNLADVQAAALQEGGTAAGSGGDGSPLAYRSYNGPEAGGGAASSSPMRGGGGDFNDAASSSSPRSRRRGAGGEEAVDEKTLDLHTRISIMYYKYNQEKFFDGSMAKVLAKYPPEVLLAGLREKYGDEPEGEERAEILMEMVT